MRRFGVDISKWDGTPDISKLKGAGVEFVIAKCAGGDVGLYTDRQWERNYKACKDAGMPVGTYFYSRAYTVAAAISEAQYTIKCLQGKQLEYPVYYDVEDAHQVNALGASLLRQIIEAYCSTLEQAGYYVGIYTWKWVLDKVNLPQYDNWVASWTTACSMSDPDMWQFGGEVNKIRSVYVAGYGPMDQNYCFRDYPTIIKNAGLNGFKKADADTTPKPEPQPKPKDEDMAKNGTADAVINAAKSQLGYYAPDDPQPGSKYGRWMADLTGESWLRGPSSEIWWCCMFVSWCLNQGGVKVPGFPTYNTDLAWNGGAKTRGVAKASIRYGDILIFDWNFSTAATDHIGFALGSPVNGYVHTIEGNVGNKVVYKDRPLSSIRYVVRPAYDGESVQPTSDKLEIDGAIGPMTVQMWQKQMKTTADGEISGQVASNHRYYPSVNAVVFDGGSGSELVRAVQRKVKASVDGIWGMETSTMIQAYLIGKGYSCGPSGTDGYFGNDSAKALQRSLNDKKWA